MRLLDQTKWLPLLSIPTSSTNTIYRWPHRQAGRNGLGASLGLSFTNGGLERIVPLLSSTPQTSNNQLEHKNPTDNMGGWKVGKALKSQWGSLLLFSHNQTPLQSGVGRRKIYILSFSFIFVIDKEPSHSVCVFFDWVFSLCAFALDRRVYIDEWENR